MFGGTPEVRYSGPMPKRPSQVARELDSLAEFIVDSAVGKPRKGDLLPDGRDPVAVALGRKGALKAVKARVTSVPSKQKRVRSAKKSATVRHKK
jgi:hypothetical protein